MQTTTTKTAAKVKEAIIIKKLLSDGSTNAKTKKNSLKSFILYLSPYTQNSFGKNVCANASKGCVETCLFTAGMGSFSSVQKARIAKTDYLLSDRQRFLDQLAKEILYHYAKAKRSNEKIAIRLNGTSDLDFFTLLQRYAQLDVTKLADHVHFYEYTKNINYIKRWEGSSNITYTFSKSENNTSLIPAAIAYGANVAAVFRKDLPETYNIGGISIPVIDGDKSDILMIYNKGKILGLRAKGKAKRDQSGFVID
jgi:GH24 family phage-related lysozyme (muramidase)